MMIRKERFRCQKCQSSITINVIVGRGVERDLTGTAKLKEWRQIHGLDCKVTSATDEEITI